MPSNALQEVATALSYRLTRAGSVRRSVEDWGWFNAVWEGGPFRRAHLERLVTAKVDIVHCVIFPHLTDPAPVFGFDAIMLGDTKTGMFLDMTPMTDAPYRWWPVPKMEGKARPLPEWAEFFSDDFIAVVPTDHDLWSGVYALKGYLRKLGFHCPEAEDKIRTAQQRYTENQRQNPKTRKMLASVLDSDEQAQRFINTVLWPDLEEGTNG